MAETQEPYSHMAKDLKLTLKNKLDQIAPFPWPGCLIQRVESVDGSKVNIDGGVYTLVRLPDQTFLRLYSLFVEVRNEIGTGGWGSTHASSTCLESPVLI